MNNRFKLNFSIFILLITLTLSIQNSFGKEPAANYNEYRVSDEDIDGYERPRNAEGRPGVFGGESSDSNRSGALITNFNAPEGDWEVRDNAPKIEANDMTAPINLLTGAVQQGAPKDGAGAAKFTGATTGIAGTVSTMSGISNWRRGGEAGKREAVFKQGIRKNEVQWNKYDQQKRLESLPCSDPACQAQHQQQIQKLEQAQKNTVEEATKQAAAAAAYKQQKGALRMKGAMEIVAGTGMLGNSIANFLAAKELNDGGGTPNVGGDPLEGDLPVGGPIDLPPDDFGDNGFRGDNPGGFPSGDDDSPKQELTKGDEKSPDTGSGGGGSSGLSAGAAGKFEDDPLADKLEEKKDKKLDSGAEEKVLGSYGDGGRDLAGLGGGDIEGMLAGLGGDDKLNSDGLDDLLASLMPPAGEENALFGPDLDPNKINEQDIDLFASIKKTHLVFYAEWKKLDEEKKKKGEPEKAKIAKGDDKKIPAFAGMTATEMTTTGNDVVGEKK